MIPRSYPWTKNNVYATNKKQIFFSNFWEKKVAKIHFWANLKEQNSLHIYIIVSTFMLDLMILSASIIWKGLITRIKKNCFWPIWKITRRCTHLGSGRPASYISALGYLCFPRLVATNWCWQTDGLTDWRTHSPQTYIPHGGYTITQTHIPNSAILFVAVIREVTFTRIKTLPFFEYSKTDKYIFLPI